MQVVLSNLHDFHKNNNVERRIKMNEQSNKNSLVSHSKFLSLVLRHNPQRIGLTLDEAGWACTDELLACLQKSSHPMSLAQLQRVVAADSKQRYSFSEDGLRIRANQGHSIQVELGLSAQQPPDVLHHGTATRFLASILEQGLTRQNRHHVHLSESLDVAATVGRRYGQLAMLIVDARRMHADGHIFYRADNGVWLTDAVPSRYLKVQA